MSRDQRKSMIDRDHDQLSLVRQCNLLDVSRASIPPGKANYAECLETRSVSSTATMAMYGDKISITPSARR